MVSTYKNYNVREIVISVLVVYILIAGVLVIRAQREVPVIKPGS